jgi:hypothetical protein
MSAASTQKADADALSDSPPFGPRAQHIDDTDGFVARYSRPSDRIDSLDRGRVGMANAAGLDA